jgi:hypothetical protein
VAVAVKVGAVVWAKLGVGFTEAAKLKVKSVFASKSLPGEKSGLGMSWKMVEKSV